MFVSSGFFCLFVSLFFLSFFVPFVVVQVPKEKVSKIMQYVKKQVDELDVREGRWITGVGIVCYAFGGILIVMRFALAPIFMEPPSRRDLSSRRKLFK